MITDTDKKIIEQLARKYHVKRVVLFGSSLSPTREYRDIDIAVEGLEEKDFYTFYGELLCALSKPIDIIDLSQKTRFVELILREGIPLYA
ncbi:MAG: nucleotidyltransferase domain-containing protein [Desulfobacterales bacterium]|jgi:predicted nucleotidyltransferase|nr:nucleotidyltransferase domain-containing protein [Desulfobacterales bacterium]